MADRHKLQSEFLCMKTRPGYVSHGFENSSLCRVCSHAAITRRPRPALVLPFAKPLRNYKQRAVLVTRFRGVYLHEFQLWQVSFENIWREMLERRSVVDVTTNKEIQNQNRMQVKACGQRGIF